MQSMDKEELEDKYKPDSFQITQKSKSWIANQKIHREVLKDNCSNISHRSFKQTRM